MTTTTDNPPTAASPTTRLDQAFRATIAQILGDEYANTDPLIKSSQNPDHGDFQANCAMSLGKATNQKPRDLAEKIATAVDVSAFAEPPTVAGPGFINIRLKPDSLAAFLDTIDTPSLGVAPDPDSHPVVIDLCGVNVAKQMHVGHLRSTIIGDSLARIFERLGRTVHRENHLGDWGLPIAMVLHHLREQGTDLNSLTLTELDRAYRDAQLSTKSDVRGLEAALRLHAGPHRIAELEEHNASAHQNLEAAKATLLKLQQGDAELDRDWHKLIDCTLSALYESLDLLNVNIGPENNRGESFFRDKLESVIDTFLNEGIAEEDEGALIVRFENRKRPMLIRKSDGGFLYATTDLAAIRFRTRELKADRVIYVVDARQQDHFKDLFDGASRIGWDSTPDGSPVTFTHIPFGSVLGTNKQPLKTRSGDNVTLKSLLDEAIERGTKEVTQRSNDPKAPTHELSPDQLAAIGQAVGIGAIKYADLSNDLTRDYVFNFDRMISFEGDTGPYLQYAHARIRSIFSKTDLEPNSLPETPIIIRDPAEKSLALVLLRYGETVTTVARTLQPHRLCGYLRDLAEAFSTFYQRCPVLKAENEELRFSRLRLCSLTQRILADGLNLLGIEAPPRM